MKRILYVAALCMAATLVFAPAAFGQTDSPITAQGAQTAPLNADGTCPEGFVNVNAPFCAQESPNTPGRIFGYGEGDLAPETDNLRQTPDGLQYSDLPDVIPGGTETVSIAPGGPCATPELAPDLIGVPIEELPNAFLNRNDPVGTPLSSPLDPDGNGIACDTPAATQQYEQPVAEAVDEETSSTTTTTPLPDTGGLPLVPLTGASLLVLGVAGFAVRRRIS